MLYCSIETPLNSDSDVADGAGRRVREFMVSGRMVVMLVGRPGRFVSGLGNSSRSTEPRKPEEGLLRV